jgi:predicted naringenin-chalcone synthase
VGPAGRRHHPPRRRHELRGPLPGPGADLGLAALLGLRPDVRRTSLQLNGCSAGCAALRLAKDLTENNRGARVLVACVELTLTSFRAPREEGDTFDALIPQALFGDGASAAVVGSDAAAGERPLFEMVSASQTLIPGTEHLLSMRLGEGGIDGEVSAKLPSFAARHVERCLVDALAILGGGEGRNWKFGTTCSKIFWLTSSQPNRTGEASPVRQSICQ